MRGKPLLTQPLRTRQAHSRLDDRGHQGGGLLTQRSSPRRARQGRDLAPLSSQALAQTPASLPQPAAVGPWDPGDGASGCVWEEGPAQGKPAGETARTHRCRGRRAEGGLGAGVERDEGSKGTERRAQNGRGT